MPKIDFSTIENWDTMTPEEKLDAIANYEYNDHSAELASMTADRDRYKNATTKTSAEIAEMKRKSRDALSAEEQKAIAAAEELGNLKEELATLKRDKQIAVFVSKGYPDDLATEKVEALINGDFDKVASVDEKFLALYKKNIEKELVNAVPPPASGSGNKTLTREDLLKMSYIDQQKFKTDNPDVYKQLIGGNN